MTCRVNEPGESAYLISRNAQIKPQPAAFGQIIFGLREQRTGRGHDALPGQGKATAESLVKSTFA